MEKVAFLRDIEDELHYATQLELLWSNLADQIKELLENPNNDSHVVLYREMHGVYRTMSLVRGDMADRRKRLAQNQLDEMREDFNEAAREHRLRDRAVRLPDEVVDKDRAQEKLSSDPDGRHLSSDPAVRRDGDVPHRVKDSRRKQW